MSDEDKLEKMFGSDDWKAKVAEAGASCIRKKLLLNSARHLLSWGTPNGDARAMQKLNEAELRYGKLTEEEKDYVATKGNE